MEFHLLSILLVWQLLVMEGIKGEASLDSYWRSMLPNTPLPKVLLPLLHPSDLQREAIVQNNLYTDSLSSYRPERLIYNRAYWSVAENFSNEKTIQDTAVIFLLAGDLLPHKKMRLNFTKSTSRSSFLPRRIADSIPFSDDRFMGILKHFSIKPESKEAQIIKQTIRRCNSPSMEGEEKYCATSLESLVDLAIAKFGKNLWALSNEVDEENKEQDYTILKAIKVMEDHQMVCHKEMYPYAVFYCHNLASTKVYMVPLAGNDGSKAKAVVVCHLDTSTWNPKHLSFQVLNVKPRGPPICHFINDDTIVWIPK